MSKNQKLIILAVVDSLILCLSYFIAAFFSYWSSPVKADAGDWLIAIGVLLVIYIVVSNLAQFNNIIWRYFTERDLVVVFGVIMLVGMLFASVAHFCHIIDASIGFYVLGALISASGAVLSRILYKLTVRLRGAHNTANKDAKRLLIVGAGISGSTIIMETKRDPHCELYPVAFVDDDPQKQGRKINNVKVAGKIADIPEVCRKYDVQIIYIAIPSATNARRAKILKECQKVNLPVKILPFYTEFGDDKSSFVNKVRDITPEELLGREPINVADERIYNFISGKTVAITGGGGSIGSELCRQIAAHSPRRLVIIDIYENNAYAIQQELRMKYGDSLNLQVYIASVREQAKIDYLFSVEKPDIVFHAAAHKHVPLMEVSPDEAVKNNIFGTYNTALAAKNNGVSRFVLISTDKAVNPTNCMGATKRVCEMVVQYFNSISEGVTTYAAVRFGNVLGSNGSVIPLFKDEIRERRDVTVTHPDIIRYFMTIPEASQLVLTAGAMAQGGEIFVLDMGEPVKIDDLAKKMISLAGLVLGKDINIRYTGLRPGEKLFEELLVGEEGLKATLNKKIFISSILPVDFTFLKKQLDELRELVKHTDVSPDAVAEKLAVLVPTFNRYVPEDKPQGEPEVKK